MTPTLERLYDSKFSTRAVLTVFSNRWLALPWNQVKCGVRSDLSPACNAVGYVDRLLLGINHLYKNPMYKRTKVCPFLNLFFKGNFETTLIISRSYKNVPLFFWNHQSTLSASNMCTVWAWRRLVLEWQKARQTNQSTCLGCRCPSTHPDCGEVFLYFVTPISTQWRPNLTALRFGVISPHR